MEIEFNQEGKMIFNKPQQIWHPESNRIMQAATFSGQEMMAIQKSDSEPDIYELNFLGLKVSGFNSMESAKECAPRFARDVFYHLSMMVEDKSRDKSIG